MKKFLLLLINLIVSSFAFAQQKILTPDVLLEIVKTHHPVAREAALQIDIAKADVLSSRGGFDPLLTSENTRKELQSTLYYNHAQHQVIIPTWYGIDVYAGVQSVNGLRTTPTETKGASSFVGVSIPFVRNLLIDSRRAILKQAGIMQDMSVAEQKSILNDLALNALNTYWMWWQQYSTYQLFTSAMKNAQKRVDLVKLAYRHGERPAIDTLEALTQLQSFMERQSEVLNELNNSRLELSTYLWINGTIAYELGNDVLPVQSTPVINEEMYSKEQLLTAVNSHPDLQQYKFKLDVLEVDRKLKMQSLLPSVNVKYNQLTNSHNVREAFINMDNNYRYGISISMPLRLSEGRGQYQKAKLKMEQTKLEQSHKQLLIETKVKQYYNEWLQLQQQVQIQKQTVTMLQQLQRGEEVRFQNGESSLFLINSREAKALEAQQKLIETISKLQQVTNTVRWAAGQL